MTLAFFPRRFPNLWGANAVRPTPRPGPHPFRMLDLVLVLDECTSGGVVGGRVVAEGLDRAGALVLKVTRLVDGSGVWVKPHRLRHLNGPRLLLIDGGKSDEPCAKLRHA